MKSKFFVYQHVRLDTNEVFYVGIGTLNKRSPTYYSRAFEKKSRNPFWKAIINKTKYKVEIVYKSSIKQEIKEKEKELIALYGRRDLGKGTLVNLTNGGDGVESFKHSEESKLKIGEASKLRKRKKGYKLNISEQGRLNRIKGASKKDSMETRLKKSMAMLGNKRGVGAKHSKSSMENALKKLRKPIECYSKNGELLHSFGSIVEAEQVLNLTHINEYLRGKRNSRKYTFKYKERKNDKNN